MVVVSERTVLVVGFDRLQLLDLAGPIEVFDAADRVAGGGAYRIVVATPGGRAVRSTSRVGIEADVALEAAAADATTAVDTLVVVGGRGTRALLDDDAVLDQIRSVSARARRTTSVCTGALVLAAAGLLDGHRATTHWQSCDLLAELAPAV